MDRREFLKLGGAAVLGAGFVDAPQLLGAAARSEVRLHRPLRLTPGTTIENTDFVVDDDFQWDEKLCALFGMETSDVTLRNVSIVGSDVWLERWNQEERPEESRTPGISSHMSAIRILRGRRIVLENVSVRGFPKLGITCSGLRESSLRTLRIEQCRMGLHTYHAVPSYDCSFEDIEVRNTWAPPVGYPSLRSPRHSVGGGGVVLEGLRNATIRTVRVLEENSGMKLVHPKDVTLSDMRTTTFMIQGDVDINNPAEPCGNVTMNDCTVDKGLGRGMLVEQANCVQISYHVQNTRMRNCSFRGVGENGHGMQIVGHCDADIRGCTFEGFNGTRGGAPAYALELLDHASVNADFEAVNQFIDQQRILLDRNAPAA